LLAVVTGVKDALMTIAEAKAMPIGQKVRIMETLWQDMQDHFEAMPVPDDVKKLLDGRRVRVARGEAALLNWDEVKAALGRG
jgi:hypothetical protein